MKTQLQLAVFLLSWSLSGPLFGQSNRGAITGTVSDPAGALIPGAQVVLTNTETGAKSDTVSTGTGNYSLLQLPVGTYKLAVEQAGFSKYEQTNIQVQVAVTTRVDVVLAVGSATESVTVTSESTQLRTENAEQSMTVAGNLIAELPINFGIGAGAIRNPLSFIQMTPGAYFNGWNNISINGGAANFKVVFEGQQSDDPYSTQVSDEIQPSVEAIEQFTLQTSNLTAEFGGVGGGGIYNFSSKSGTNQLHGSAYSYIENTALNAGIPFTDDGTGQHQKVVKHLADYGFTVGGPVWIPRLYNGKNKTFFFFNLERYRDREALYNGITTVPNAEFLTGNLSNNLLVTGNRNLGTDFAGRAIIQNAIYDPTSAVTDSSGRRVLQVFPNNAIPQSRIDPVSAKILAQFPKPNIGNDLFVNNFAETGDFYKLQQLPSLKVDQNFGSKFKVSGFLESQSTTKSNGVDGLPAVLSQVRIQYIRSQLARLNADYTISPTLLFHFGAGYQQHRNPDTVPPVSANYDNTQLGIVGAPGTGFPRIGGIGDNVYGGMTPSFGPGSRNLFIGRRLSGLPTLSWVHQNHTYKIGVEYKYDTTNYSSKTNTSPAYSFSGAETSQQLYGQVLPTGTGIGSAWASFLLGNYDSLSAGNGQALFYRRTSWALFAQDSWKLTKKLTLDYGLRWDLQQPIQELHNRIASFSPTTPNPNAGGLPGGVMYEGSGPGRCNCQFAATYPYAIAPRFGVAYQINAKTVIRAGWGLSYGPLVPLLTDPSASSMGFNTVTIPSPGNGVGAGFLSQRLVFNQAALFGAQYDPGLNVVPGGGIQSAPAQVDRNSGRPSRVNQWNISLQREVIKDLVVEAAYVGNHGVWEANGSSQGFYDASVGNLINYDAVSPAVLAAHGLGDLTNANTRSLLSSTIGSAAAVAAGFTAPYAGFPSTASVLQSLRPFPQYSSIGQYQAPLGDSWYDALQTKVIKRFSHGLTASATYTFSKTLDSTTNAGSIYDRGSFKGLAVNDYPHLFSLSVDYTIPAIGPVKRSRIARAILSDWRVTSLDTIQSGDLLASPTSSNSIGSYVSTGYTRMVRVSGQPLYLININCNCIDPTQQTVLNPAAWQNQAAGVPGSNIVYYNDFRGQRRPIVSGGLGKAFRIREKASFSVRAEFFNLFNQLLSLPNPSTGSPQNPPTRSNSGLLTGGFGYLNYSGISANSVSSSLPTPRTGQIVARIDF
ncbi:MAG TPA: TonB-dependent receptor [Candidatus Acidoferrales bacterium]|nr:TonB-dependent receptor [Candidatus Acidoferrales bacterium]